MIIIAGYSLTEADKRDSAVAAFAEMVAERGSTTGAWTWRSAPTLSIRSGSTCSSCGVTSSRWTRGAKSLVHPDSSSGKLT